MKCPTCCGNGQVATYGDSGREEDDICPTCLGSGEVAEDREISDMTPVIKYPGKVIGCATIDLKTGELIDAPASPEVLGKGLEQIGSLEKCSIGKIAEQAEVRIFGLYEDNSETERNENLAMFRQAIAIEIQSAIDVAVERAIENWHPPEDIDKLTADFDLQLVAKDAEIASLKAALKEKEEETAKPLKALARAISIIESFYNRRDYLSDQELAYLKAPLSAAALAPMDGGKL